MCRSRNKGFTLLEGIITIGLVSVIAVSCMGVISTMVRGKFTSDNLLEEQLAVRQGLLAVTREIRKDPEEMQDKITNGGGIYSYTIITPGNILEAEGGIYQIANIAACTVELDPANANKVIITIEASTENASPVTAVIHLRIF